MGRCCCLVLINSGNCGQRERVTGYAPYVSCSFFFHFEYPKSPESCKQAAACTPPKASHLQLLKHFNTNPTQRAHMCIYMEPKVAQEHTMSGTHTSDRKMMLIRRFRVHKSEAWLPDLCAHSSRYNSRPGTKPKDAAPWKGLG